MHNIGFLAALGPLHLAISNVLAVMCAGVLKSPEVSMLVLLEIFFSIFWRELVPLKYRNSTCWWKGCW